jgi:hypothetical protein
MAEIQYLVPGEAYVNEDLGLRAFLIPGGNFVNETSATAAALLTPTIGALLFAGLAPSPVQGTILTPLVA